MRGFRQGFGAESRLFRAEILRLNRGDIPRFRSVAPLKQAVRVQLRENRGVFPIDRNPFARKDRDNRRHETVFRSHFLPLRRLFRPYTSRRSCPLPREATAEDG